MKKIILSMSVMLSLTGCLKMRGDTGGDDKARASQQQQMPPQVVAKADEGARVGDLESEIRRLNGKIEALEYRLGSRLSNENEQDQKLSQNVDALMEQMRNFDDRLARLESKSSASAAPVVTPTPTKVKSTEATPSLFAQADSLFEAKDWKKAIVAYEKYRETYPKGRFWGEATYKIGVCFQELGLKPDAKTFFQLVVNREPTSTAARKAKYRLSQIK